MKKNQKLAHSIDSLITAAIESRGPGSIFVPTDFLHLGSRQAIDIVLHRLTRKGKIRRLSRGIYDYPEEHRIIGKLHPSTEKIASALTERDNLRMQPTGAYAANILGLSEQVPAKAVFLTDGPNRIIRIGSRTIQLRKTTLKNMAMTGKLSGLLVQALRHIGKENISKARIKHLMRTLPLKERQELLLDIRLAPDWMRSIFKILAEEKS